jgi:hypothetical protein
MARNGSLRAADADRELVVERLRAAAAEGRIGHDELDERVSRALKARTYGELDATIADLPRPGGPSAERRTPFGAGARGGQHRGTAGRRPAVGHWMLGTVRENPWLLLFAIPVVAVTGAMLLAASVMWTVLMVAVVILGGRHTRFGAGARGGAWGAVWHDGARRARHWG